MAFLSHPLIYPNYKRNSFEKGKKERSEDVVTHENLKAIVFWPPFFFCSTPCIVKKIHWAGIESEVDI